MSLDITIVFDKPVPVKELAPLEVLSGYSRDDENSEFSYEYNINITHNLGPMANAVPITRDDTIIGTLYELLWYPEKLGITTTTDAFAYLKEGLNKAIDMRKELLKYNPVNGWGTYEGLLRAVIVYADLCKKYPDCKIEISR